MNWTMTMMMVLALSATTAVAQTAKSLQFGPGGNTIAGPGVHTVEAGPSEIIFLQDEEAPMDLCATVVNVGKSGIASLGVVDPDGYTNATAVDPGEAASVCQKDANLVRVGCNSGTCEVLWRVDQAR